MLVVMVCIWGEGPHLEVSHHGMVTRIPPGTGTQFPEGRDLGAVFFAVLRLSVSLIKFSGLKEKKDQTF